jgi:hypothetical protein
MAIGTQDFYPIKGTNESSVVTYHIAFTTNGTSDPTEATFFGGHISDITKVASKAGVYAITLTSKMYMYKVIGASGMMLESADPSGTADNEATFHWVNMYIDETVAGGCTIYAVARAGDDRVGDDTTGRRIVITLHVLTETPVYSYS